MAATFPCVIATPHCALFNGDVYYVYVPGKTSSFGVMAKHEMIVALNGEGLMRVHLDEAGKDVRTFLIHEGATQFYNGGLQAACRYGIETKDIDPEISKQRAEGFRKQLEELEKKDSDQSSIEYEVISERLKWYELQLRYLAGEVK